MIEILGKYIETVRQDKAERLQQFKKAKAKMDDEDIQNFWEDVRKVDRIEKCNSFSFILSHYGGVWVTIQEQRRRSEGGHPAALDAPLRADSFRYEV